MRRAVLAALLVLAGCATSPSPGPDPSSSPSPIPAWTFESIAVGPGGDAETSVLVGEDGTIMACAHGGFSRASPTWRSLDNGTTWQPTDPQPNPIVSGDCDFAVLDDGTWAVVYDTIASATVAVSTDRGATWTLNYAAALPLGGVDRPWLASEGNTFYLAYADVMATLPAINTLAISRDGGRMWTEQHVAHTASPDQTERLQTIIGHPMVRDGTIRIPLTSANLQTGGPTWLGFAVSRDDGQTWSEEDAAGPYDTNFHLAAADQAEDGTLFVTKVESHTGGMGIDVLVSRDDGASWATIAVAANVSFPSVAGPWLDVRPDGSVTLAWVAEEAGGRVVWAARINATDVLRPPTALTQPVADPSVFEFIMVDHDADGRAFIVYPMDTGDCTAEAPTLPDRNQQCIWLLRESL